MYWLLFCLTSSPKNNKLSTETERERQRQSETKTETERDKDRDRDREVCVIDRERTRFASRALVDGSVSDWLQ